VPFLRDRLERYLAWYDKYLKNDGAKGTSEAARAPSSHSPTPDF
jgi:hypothetical protein